MSLSLLFATDSIQYGKIWKNTNNTNKPQTTQILIANVITSAVVHLRHLRVMLVFIMTNQAPESYEQTLNSQLLAKTVTSGHNKIKKNSKVTT